MATVAEIKVWWKDADNHAKQEEVLRWQVAEGLYERNEAGETQQA